MRKTNLTSKILPATALLCGGALLLPDIRADYPTAVLDQNPVAYWRLEATGAIMPEVARNAGSLGTAADGEYLGAPRLQQPGALAAGDDTAAAFNGAGQLMEAPNSPALNPEPPFTIEGWVKPNVAMTGNTLRCPLASLNRTPPTAEGWIFYQSATAWNFRLGDSANNYTVNMNSTSGVTPGEWYHLVATYDGTTAKLYVNGVEEASQDSANFAPNLSVPFGIGARGDHAFFFDGSVDEVALYPSVLTADRIQAHYEAGRNASPAQPYDQMILADGPLAYWRLNDAPNRKETVNLGSLGEAANGVYQVGSTPGADGPQPPLENGFEAGNKAVELDGVTGNVAVNEPLNLNTNTVTITCWIQSWGAQATYAGVVFARGGHTVAGLDFHGDTGELGYHWNDAPNTYNWASGLMPVDNLWSFVALVVKPDQAVLYLDDGIGMLSATNNVTHPVEEFDGPLRIGLDNGPRAFFGLIDEVAIFDRALTEAEVRTLAAAGFGANTPPEILAQPSAPTDPIYEGGSFTLSVEAAGEPPLSYQWRKNGTAIPDATEATYMADNVTSADSGSYTVVVSNSAGSTTSDAVTITVKATETPTITEQPQPVTILAGGKAVFHVAAIGGVNLEYQWQFQGADIPDATSDTLVLENVQPDQAGDYTAVVSTTAGSATSDPATLTVIAVEEGSYAYAVMEDQPVGYWRLGESDGPTAFDYVGGYDGEYMNGPTLGQPGALKDDPDTAVGFTPDLMTKVEVPFQAALNPPQFTVELWARVAEGSSGYRSPLTSRDDGPQRGYIFYAAANDQWQFWTGAGAGWDSIAGPSVVPGEWVHLVGTYDGTTKRFYVNGHEVGSSDAALALNTAQLLRIGGGASENPDGNYFFAGDVDEVAIYDHALSPERVQLHYGAALGAGTPPSITTPPNDQAALEGETVTFTVAAAGSLPLAYQWRHDGADIPGATEDTLVLSGVQAADAGSYTVVVSNPAGTVVSDPGTLTVVTIPTTPYAQIVEADNPVSYWRLGETSGVIAADQVGTNPGTYLNGVVLGQPGALVDDGDYAAGFLAGQQTKVEVPWSPDLNGTVFTIELWAKVTGGGGHRSPLTSRADFPQRGYIFYANPNNIWQFWTGRGDTSGWDIMSGPEVQLDQWAHLVGTYDGAVKQFYVNGRLVGQVETAFGPNDEALLRFGAGQTEDPTGNFFFEGDVDEVAYYDHVLTPAQILTHYVRAVPPQAEPTLAIEKTADGVVITWENGALQQAAEVTGPYTDVAGESPLTLQPTETQQFFRVRQ